MTSLFIKTRAFEVEDIKRSYFELATSILLVSTLFIATIISSNSLLKLLLAVIQGLAIVRIFCIYHDYHHRAIFKKNRNWFIKTLMRLVSYIVLTPEDIWFSSHNFHHKNNCKKGVSHIGSFQTKTTEEFNAMSKTQRTLFLFKRSFVFVLLSYFFVFLSGFCLLPIFNNWRKSRQTFLTLVCHVTIILFLILMVGIVNAVYLFILPMSISTFIGGLLFYLQHNYPNVRYYHSTEWSLEKSAIESSSYLKMPRILNWFTANIGLHHIHHMNSAIPFYRLPEVYNKVEELQKEPDLYFTLKSLYSCFQLKLWDETNKQMISLKNLQS